MAPSSPWRRSRAVSLPLLLLAVLLALSNRASAAEYGEDGDHGHDDMMPDHNHTDGNVTVEVVMEGWLYDVYCMNQEDGIAPDGSNTTFGIHNHMVGCMLLTPCMNSGYLLMQRSLTGMYFPIVKFTNSSTATIAEWLMQFPMDTTNVYVYAYGTMMADGLLNVTMIDMADEPDVYPPDAMEVTYTYTGWIYDNYCLASPTGIAEDSTNVSHGVHDHMVGCLLLRPCIDSGYALMTRDAMGMYHPIVMLTKESTEMVVEWLEMWPMDMDNINVTITGMYDASGMFMLESISGCEMMMPMEGEVMLYEGWLYDMYCMNQEDGIAPDGSNTTYGIPDHVVGCMLLTACRESGYLLMQRSVTGRYFPTVVFTNSSTMMIVDWLMQFPPMNTSNVYVHVTGMMMDGLLNVSMIGMKEVPMYYPADDEAVEYQYVGWVYDNYCLASPTGIAEDGTNVTHGVHDHMVGCLLLPPCIESGYTLMKADLTGMYHPVVMFTNVSTALVLEYLEQLPQTTSDVQVVASGYYTTDMSNMTEFNLTSIMDYQAEEPKMMSFEGWLYDKYCLASPTAIAEDGTNVSHGVHDHMVGCLLLPLCIESGYVLMQRSVTGMYFPTVELSAASTNLAVEWLKNFPRNTSNVYVRASGYLNRARKIVMDGIMNAEPPMHYPAVSTAMAYTYSGWLYDMYCLQQPDGIAPDGSNVTHGVHNHMVACMLLEPCIASGYLLQARSPTGEYHPTVVFTQSSTEVVLQWLGTLAFDMTNVYVTVTGALDGEGMLEVETMRGSEMMVPEEGAVMHYEGWLYDVYCMNQEDGIAPDGSNTTHGIPDHVVGCMLLTACRDSGFLLMQRDSTGRYFPTVVFTNSSTPMVAEWLRGYERGMSNVYVHATGTVAAGGLLDVTMLELKDAPMHYPADAMMTQYTYEGWLYDMYCYNREDGIAPDGSNTTFGIHDHMVGCLLLSPCINSGYAIMAVDLTGMYHPVVLLTNASTMMAVDWLQQFPAMTNNVVVRVTGYYDMDGLFIANSIMMADEGHGMEASSEDAGGGAPVDEDHDHEHDGDHDHEHDHGDGAEQGAGCN